MGITDLATYIIGVCIIILLPGPNSLYVLSVASKNGVAMGYRAACGVFVGDALLMFVAASGGAFFLHQWPAVFHLIKIAGALYLAWLGWQLLSQLWVTHKAPNHAGPSHPDTQFSPTTKLRAQFNLQSPFGRALVISLLNPKAILFFLSFFVQFVDPNYSYPAFSFLILGGIGQLASFTYLSLLIIAGARLAQFFNRKVTLQRVANGAVGALFIGFALKLSTASL